MPKLEKKKNSRYLTVIKILTISLAIITVIGGVFLTNALIDKLLKETRSGDIQIKENKIDAIKSFLGTELQELNDILRKQLNIESTEGALVNSVIENSPADDAGILRGDVIVRFGRQSVTDPGQLQNLVAEKSPGDRIKVTVKRDGKSKSLYLKLSKIPTDKSPVSLTQGQIPDQTTAPATPGWGMEISPLTPQMQQGGNTPQSQEGLVVTSVTAGGAAAAAGIQAGDIILSANSQPTSGPSEFYTAIAGSQGVALDILRGGQTSYVTVQADPSMPPVASLGMTANYLPVGNNNEDDDEGYKGMPPTIPPRGEYDPETMGARTTAGTPSRTDVCICPMCGTTVTHPAGTPCSQMSCPVCDSRLINAAPGVTTSFDDTRTPGQTDSDANQGGNPQRPSYAGAAKGQRDLDDPGSQTGGGEDDEDDKGRIPSTIPPMGNPRGGEAINVVNIWQTGGQPTGGMPTGGMPTAGMPTAGMPTAGQPTAGPQTTAGTNRVQVCVCPVCGTTVGHPAGVSCSELTCPECGSRLISASSGSDTSPSQQDGSQQGNAPPSTGQRMGSTTQGIATSDKPETIPPTDKGEMTLTAEGGVVQKIAVASQGEKTNSLIAPVFDRAPYFIIYDMGGIEALRNPNADDSKDVGVQSAQFVVNNGAGAVIAKDISLEAVRELNRLNVRVYSGVSGTVSQAILRYTKDRLKETILGIDKSSSSSDQNELQYKDKTKDKKGVITTNTSVQF